MDEIIKLKAEIYDHLAQIEAHQKAIQEKNQKMQQLSQVKPEVQNEQNPVDDKPTA